MTLRNLRPSLVCLLTAVSIAVASSSVARSAEDRPMTGTADPEFAPVDHVINDFMDTIDAQAASVAVAVDGRLVYARGFGWSDEQKSTPTTVENTFRIASNTKPITAAVIKHLVRAGKITLDMPVFDYLGIAPYGGRLGDPRIKSITVQHLLDHKGGWDRDETFDPTYSFDKIKKEMHLDRPVTRADMIQYMLAQPLQHAPGNEKAYSNFGYLVLGRVIEKATGRPYIEVVQSVICGPLGIHDIRLSDKDPAKRNPAEVFYPRESGLDIPFRDSLGGLTASAPSLIRFLHKYCIDGDLRYPSHPQGGYHTGSHPHSISTLTEERTDGIDYVVLFNSRRDEHYSHDKVALRKAMNKALDQIHAAGH